MYRVPLEPPKHCNECPFGVYNYNFPLMSGFYQSEYFSQVDNKKNEIDSYGYVCNIQFQMFGKYKTVQRARCGEDVEKPEWCPLIKEE